METPLFDVDPKRLSEIKPGLGREDTLNLDGLGASHPGLLPGMVDEHLAGERGHFEDRRILFDDDGLVDPDLRRERAVRERLVRM
jgi:hypothetical protein